MNVLLWRGNVCSQVCVAWGVEMAFGKTYVIWFMKFNYLKNNEITVKWCWCAQGLLCFSIFLWNSITFTTCALSKTSWNDRRRRCRSRSRRHTVYWRITWLEDVSDTIQSLFFSCPRPITARVIQLRHSECVVIVNVLSFLIVGDARPLLASLHCVTSAAMSTQALPQTLRPITSSHSVVVMWRNLKHSITHMSSTITDIVNNQNLVKIAAINMFIFKFTMNTFAYGLVEFMISIHLIQPSLIHSRLNTLNLFSIQIYVARSRNYGKNRILSELFYYHFDFHYFANCSAANLVNVHMVSTWKWTYICLFAPHN